MLGAVKAVGLENISHAAVKAFNHADGSGCPGPRQVMPFTKLLAQQVQRMVENEHFLETGKKAICELFPKGIVIKSVAFVQGPKECLGACCRLGGQH